MRPSAHGKRDGTTQGQRRLVVTLAVTTLLLGAATTYLAGQLMDLRGRVAGSAAMPGTAATTADLVPIAPAPTPAPIAAPATSPPTSTPTPAPDAAQTARLRARIDELNDPATRARRVADLRAALAATAGDAGQLAQLQPHEIDRVLDHMAESMVRDRQRVAQCRLEPGCNPDAGRWQRAGDALREMELDVGVDVVARLNQQEALLRVRQFNDLLPAAGKLSDATATALASALAEERRRSADEESSAAGIQRMQDRAAALLTAEQMALFRAPRSQMLTWD